MKFFVVCMACANILFFNLTGFAQTSEIKAVNENYSFVERSDWLRYDNGVYTGHTFREVRSSVIAEGKTQNGDILFAGSFIVLEETLRDMRGSARAVDDVRMAKFSIANNGRINIIDDNGFPPMRDFPVYSTEAVRVGLKWTGDGKRALDPLNNGNVVIAPLFAEYEYKGIEDYNGEKVYRISANYASRYGEWRSIPSTRPGASTQSGSPSRNNVAMTNKAIEEREPFIALSGSHAVDILIRVSDGVIMLLRDKLDETYLWSSGNTVRFSGFTLSFGQGLVPVNKLVIEKSAKLIPDTEYKNVPEGVRLIINNLNFKADSDELLDGEGMRLNSIAAALGQAKGKTFLVEGHTARSGDIETEMPLSALRAKRIVDEMVSRGIPASNFVYKGWGGTKPVGDNETSDGRAKNRRVEITILE